MPFPSLSTNNAHPSYTYLHWYMGMLSLTLKIDHRKFDDNGRPWKTTPINRSSELTLRGFGAGDRNEIGAYDTPENILYFLKNIVSDEDLETVRQEFIRLGWEYALETKEAQTD